MRDHRLHIIVMALAGVLMLSGCESTPKASTHTATTTVGTDETVPVQAAPEETLTPVQSAQTPRTPVARPRPKRVVDQGANKAIGLRTQKPGFVISPYAIYEEPIDVTGLPSGSEVKCPYTGRIFIVP